jgi:DNA-binding NarL/FixJ family response regulator
MSQQVEPRTVSTVLVSRPGVGREAVRAVLALAPWLEISGTAGDGLTGLNLVRVHQPDLLVVDSNLLEDEILALVKQVKESWFHIRCLVFTTTAGQHQKMLAGGADAALSRDGSLWQLMETLEQVVEIT